MLIKLKTEDNLIIILYNNLHLNIISVIPDYWLALVKPTKTRCRFIDRTLLVGQVCVTVVPYGIVVEGYVRVLRGPRGVKGSVSYRVIPLFSRAGKRKLFLLSTRNGVLVISVVVYTTWQTFNGTDRMCWSIKTSTDVREASSGMGPPQSAFSPQPVAYTSRL